MTRAGFKFFRNINKDRRGSELFKNNLKWLIFILDIDSLKATVYDLKVDLYVSILDR